MRRRYPRHPLTGVGAVIKDDGRILLVKRRFPPNRGGWAAPGGLVELGEGVREALKREVKEELGLKIEVGDLIEVFDSITLDRAGRVKFHYVIADFLAKPEGGALRLSSEVADVKWATPEEATRLELTPNTRKLLIRLGFISRGVE